MGVASGEKFNKSNADSRYLHAIYCEPARNLWKRWWHDHKRFTKHAQNTALEPKPPKANSADQSLHSPKTLLYTLDNSAVQVDGDKLYIQTPFGEIVLVGEPLKQLSQPNVA